MERFDANNDGTIDYEEFAVLARERVDGDNIQMLYAAARSCSLGASSLRVESE